MEKNITRKNRPVVNIHVEIDANVYRGLKKYADEYTWSQRRIIEDAINCWIIQRDMSHSKTIKGE